MDISSQITTVDQNTVQNSNNQSTNKTADVQKSGLFSADSFKKNLETKENEFKSFLKNKKRIEKLLKDLKQLDAKRQKITDELAQLQQSIF